nr:hypothetical protein [Bacillus infantis]
MRKTWKGLFFFGKFDLKVLSIGECFRGEETAGNPRSECLKRSTWGIQEREFIDQSASNGKYDVLKRVDILTRVPQTGDMRYSRWQIHPSDCLKRNSPIRAL